MKLSDFEVEYHRNGICGEGFHAIKFKWDDADGGARNMVGIVYEGEGRCSVLDIDLLAADAGVKFGLNSWRGDHFEADLRKAINDNRKKLDVVFDAKYKRA